MKDSNESDLAMDLADTYINRRYEPISDKARHIIKCAWVDGYTKGLLRAANLTKQILEKIK